MSNLASGWRACHANVLTNVQVVDETSVPAISSQTTHTRVSSQTLMVRWTMTPKKKPDQLVAETCLHCGDYASMQAMVNNTA